MHLENIVIQTLAIKDHRIKYIDTVGENVIIHIEAKRRRRLPCGVCGRRCKQVDATRSRDFLHVPFWGMCVFLRYRPRRVQCPTCGLRREAIPWAQGKQRITNHLALTLAVWTKILAVDVVASLFGVHWNTVYAAVRRSVAYGLQHRTMNGILYIGVDEISRKKGHHYLTNVYDLQSKTLLWSGEGRSEQTMRAFFDTCGETLRHSVRGVCCDMWAPYMSMIKEYLPDAVLVFDKFHLIRHLLTAVDTVRKQEVRALQQSHPDLLKGTKYVFLRNPENLTSSQRQRLGYLEKLNLRITRAYLLKEKFKQFFRYRSRTWAEKFLRQWLWQATHARLKPMRDFARTVTRHLDGILAWIDVPINNGVVEALNNNAKAISHRSRGFATAQTYSLILLHCLGNLPMQELSHSFV